MRPILRSAARPVESGPQAIMIASSRAAVALAAAALLSSCALPWAGSDEVPDAASGAVSTGSAAVAPAAPQTMEEFAAHELSGALIGTSSAPAAATGATIATSTGTVAGTGSAPTVYDRLAAAREAHRRNVFAAFTRRGDWYFLRNDKETALKSYLVAFSRSDAPAAKKTELADKIGETYFALKRFPEAVRFYKKAGDVPASSALRFALALSYADDAEKVSLLPSLALTPDQKTYFAISYSCRESADRCVDSIRNYSGTGELVTNLKASLANFEALAADDVAYRDALLASAFLKNKDYAAAATVADAILKRRPDYAPVLKLAGRAWWEIARYDEANKALQTYYRAQPTDVEAAYLLGLSYLGKKDYDTSSVFFNRAVLGGYQPRADAERHLAYNYALMESPANMWQVLGYLLKEPDAVESDFSTAAWLALNADNAPDAETWLTSGLRKFPRSPWLNALAVRLLRQKGDAIAQKNALDAALAADPENPLTILEHGVWLTDRDPAAAKTEFTRVADMDPEGPFGTDAAQRLAEIGSGTTIAPSGTPVPSPAPTIGGTSLPTP